MTESRLSESQRLLSELWRTVNAITRDVEALLRPHGITHGQLQVLLAVAAQPQVHQRELSRRLSVSPGNVSMLVTKLVRSGYLQRTPAGAAQHLSLTARAESLLTTLAPERERYILERFSDLSVAQIRELNQALGHLHDP